MLHLFGQILSLFLSSTTAFAQQMVEVEQAPDPSMQYHLRRPSWGVDIQVTTEQFAPVNYVSESHSGLTFEELNNTGPIMVNTFSLGVRKNFTAGAVICGAKYGQGDKNLESGESTNYVDSDLQIHRYTGYLSLIADDLFSEPYVAPYVELSFNKFTFRDESNENDDSGQTAGSLSTTIGLAVQLNWIDTYNSYESRRNAGLENTYLEIFATKSFDSGSEEDPDFSTEWSLGAGLRFEW